MDFINKLDEEQKIIGRKIAIRAKEMGIDPRLAVTLAFRESSLRMPEKPGADGEIGIMQVRPSTAKMIGFDPDELKDPDRNIEIGLTYLKQGLDRYKSPVLAVAGYNTGYDHPYFSDPDKPLPRSTKSYLEDIKELGGFSTALRAEEGAPKADAEVEVKEAAPAAGTAGGTTTTTTETEGGGRPGDALRAIASVLGGATGMGLASQAERLRGTSPIFPAKPTAAAAAVPAAPAAPAGVTPPSTGGAAMRAPVAGGPAGPVSAGPVSAGATGPTRLGVPGTFPEAVGPGSATFNYARSYGLPEIEAGRALGTGSKPGETWDLLEKRRQALQTIQQRFPSGQFVENPRFGGIMTPEQGVGRGPRASYVTQAPEPVAPGQPAPATPAGALRQVPPPAPVATTPPPPGALERVMSGAKTAGGVGLDIGTRLLANPMVAGASGGASAVEAAQQFITGRREQDPIAQWVGGISGGLAAASMLPLPVKVRAAAAVGAPLSLYLYDKLKPYQSVLERTFSPMTAEEARFSAISGGR